MTCPDYRRARSPDQKAERAELLLAAARELLAEGVAPGSLSLAEIAARAGMAKSNVYRYFESREAILLGILADDAMEWVADVLARLPPAAPAGAAADRFHHVIDATVGATLARPRLCELLSVLPSVLEHNVSVETVTAFKRGSAAAQQALVDAARAAVPELSAADHRAWLRYAITFLVGGWPLAHPPDAARVALDAPDLRHLRHDLHHDLRDAVQLIGLGLLTRAAG